ncbi:hypothetical protein QJS10_CPB04g01512 [Acorus calamus]|uniref:Uncharacterized protein n=1 Tax=Acorus calamus TaxID=4465 RepID=A0AAV9F154_ACOCL|nr:hypothetical protein QJS10_CPB04g01512 [Acorus calamus]
MSFFTGKKYHPRFQRRVNANIEENHRIDGSHCFPKLHAMLVKETVFETQVHEQRIVGGGGDGSVIITQTVETGGIDSAAEEYIKRRYQDLEFQKLQSMRVRSLP